MAPEIYAPLAALLSADERQRAAGFRLERDRLRYTVARAALRQLLARELNAAATDIAFDYGRYGKPALAGGFAQSGLCFNVSHSGEFALVAVIRGREIGVDIEALRALADEERLARRHFSEMEFAEYLAEHASGRQLAYFNCWTRKEAVLKAMGLGLTFPLQDYEVTLSPSMPARLRRVRELEGDASGWCLQGFSPERGFVAAVAVQGRYCELLPLASSCV